MTEQIFSKNGLYYRMNEFRENQLTLVFIHGLSGSSSAWLPYENFFKDKYNTLSLDLRGHGKSPKFKNYSDYEMGKLAEDVNDLIDHLGIKNFVLIGHSFGTLVAFEFLIHHQEKVRAVVFISPNIAVGKIKIAHLFKPLFNIFKPLVGFWKFSPRVGKHIDYSNYKNTGDWNLRRMFADISNTGLRAYFYGTLQSYEQNFELILERIKIPVLIIHGEKDTIFPIENSKAMMTKIKDSKFVSLPNADHILVLNNFSEVSNEISKFLVEYKNAL
ncbi:MAG: alpha/beta hydrolase [Candidatus Paceibacterota bacterium]|jgi:pimeloyl-ACP methyl ester carboxylesterase